MNETAHGRALLAAWEAAKPSNYFEDDDYLRAALARRLPPDRLAALTPALVRAGADSAGPVNRLAMRLDTAENLPRLEVWSSIGERRNEIVFHPAHDEIGRLVWRSGVMAVLAEPGGVTAHAALSYLFGLNGEVPHLCSLACTAGLVKVLQRAGADWMRRDWLPRLLERDYDRRWHGAQFLTEVQGGSDVGSNACVARPCTEPAGAWRISGEKWFCSNVSADLYAVSARPQDAPAGTAGVALFVVPRRLADGRPNGVVIRRLKEKLGTRTLPTAELDFTDALAWPVGGLEDGFRLLMGVVINTSRLAVATGTSAIMRRAFVEAFHYARTREAFGRRLIEFPAVRRQLAEMRALLAGALASTLFVAAREDRLTADGTHPEDDALFRTAVNLTKFICSSDAALVVHHGIEILGGNGTIEDFSPLPRLYREVPVQESWEGPHNTLMAQVLRDALRSKMAYALLDASEELAIGIRTPAHAALRERTLAALDDTRDRLTALLRRDAADAALHIRSVAARMARLFQVAVLLDDAASDEGASVPWLGAAAQFLLERDVVAGYDPVQDPAYAATIAGLVGPP